MERKILKLIMAFSFIFVLSCSDESGEIAQQVIQEPETVEIKPIPLDELEKMVAAPGFENGRVAAASNATWQRDPKDGESFFFREGNKVYEKSIRNGVVFTFSIWIEDSGNFLYLVDPSRNFHMSLPTWNQGSYAPSWIWDTGAKKWVQWRQFKYSTCFSDREKPTISPSPCNNRGECDLRSSYHSSFPAQVPDFRKSVYFWYNLSDNCDSDLTINQFPAPGSSISSPSRTAVWFEVIDNQNNSMSFFFIADFKEFPF